MNSASRASRVERQYRLIVTRLRQAFAGLTPIESMELCIQLIETVRDLREQMKREAGEG